MLGDTLTYSRNYPSPGTPYGPAPLTGQATVVTGDSDLMSWSAAGGWGPESGTVYARFNAEANSILVSLPNTGGYIDTGPDFFDGYVITGFSHDILAAQATYTGLTLSFLSRELRLDFLGDIPVGEFSIALRFDDNAATVPEPSAAALALTALLMSGLAVRRRWPSGRAA